MNVLAASALHAWRWPPAPGVHHDGRAHGALRARHTLGSASLFSHPARAVCLSSRDSVRRRRSEGAWSAAGQTVLASPDRTASLDSIAQGGLEAGVGLRLQRSQASLGGAAPATALCSEASMRVRRGLVRRRGFCVAKFGEALARALQQLQQLNLPSLPPLGDLRIFLRDDGRVVRAGEEKAESTALGPST